MRAQMASLDAYCNAPRAFFQSREVFSIRRSATVHRKEPFLLQVSFSCTLKNQQFLIFYASNEIVDANKRRIVNNLFHGQRGT